MQTTDAAPDSSTVSIRSVPTGMFVEAIGNTPLIKLNGASELTRRTILGKAEFMNPGQSVKDRAALFIIQDAQVLEQFFASTFPW